VCDIWRRESKQGNLYTPVLAQAYMQSLDHSFKAGKAGKSSKGLFGFLVKRRELHRSMSLNTFYFGILREDYACNESEEGHIMTLRHGFKAGKAGRSLKGFFGVLVKRRERHNSIASKSSALVLCVEKQGGRPRKGGLCTCP
jgi:hypothetical protein